MNYAQIETELRRYIGSPTTNQVSSRELSDFLISGLDWLAGVSDYPVRTLEQSIALVEDQEEYALPLDCMQMIWVEYNGKRLLPSTTWAWERDGLDYRGVTAATPTQFAILSQTLLVYPRPSDDAITTAAYLPIRYIASQQGIAPSGTPQLADGDQRLFILHAAEEWWVLHPGEKGEGLAKAQAMRAMKLERLKEAKARWEQPTAGYQSRISVTVRRVGAAR